MSNKGKEQFEFAIPVTKIGFGTPKLIGNLYVHGTGHDLGEVSNDQLKYSSKIDKVLYHDIDILPLLSAIPVMKPFVEELRNAAHSHVERNLFKQNSLSLQNELYA